MHACNVNVNTNTQDENPKQIVLKDGFGEMRKRKQESMLQTK